MFLTFNLLDRVFTGHYPWRPRSFSDTLKFFLCIFQLLSNAYLPRAQCRSNTAATEMYQAPAQWRWTNYRSYDTSSLGNGQNMDKESHFWDPPQILTCRGEDFYLLNPFTISAHSFSLFQRCRKPKTGKQ